MYFGVSSMFGIRRTKKDIKSEGSIKKNPPKEMLLATLCIFSRKGKDEVSLSELQESIAEYQKEFPKLGYTYSNNFLYSLEVLNDLKELDYNSYIRRHHYKHDSFLPKRFLSLTKLGKGRGSKILEKLSESEMQYLVGAVGKAIENHEHRWRLWARH